MASYLLAVLLPSVAILTVAQGACPYSPIARRTNEVGYVLPNTNTSDHAAAMKCMWNASKVFYDGVCDPLNKFRPVDGVCNNLLFPLRGSPLQPFQRLLPATYDDGAQKPRVGSSQSRFLPLPSARVASTQCHASQGTLQAPDLTRNYAFVYFGQFLDHDVTAVPESEVPEACCPRLRRDGLHPDTLEGGGPCFPIPVPPGDRLRTNCLEFHRSETVEEEATRERPREQINALTSFVDGSNIYGSTIEETNSLRRFCNGTLKTSDKCSQLPLDDRFPCVVHTSVGPQLCKAAGDIRVNEVPPLTVIHTVFHRLHNRLAELVRERFHGFNDQRIFQEARKLTIAIYQQIVFYEWLPLVIGSEGMRLARLHEKYCYNPFINPNLFNVFSGVCFRFGHTMLPFGFNTRFGLQNLENTFFRPAFVSGCLGNQAEGIDTTLSSILNAAARKRDRFFIRAITDNLFKDVFNLGDPPTDLVSRNIQRGRDHGLPPYLEWVKLFKPEYLLNKASIASFDQTCLDAYNNVTEDVDAFVGAMTEDAWADSINGFLCTRIIGEQFAALRNSDRFFFETPDINIGFDSARLTHIKRATFAWVLCQTTGVSRIQPNAFLRPDHQDNEPVDCRFLGGPSLRVLTNVFSRAKPNIVCPFSSDNSSNTG